MSCLGGISVHHVCTYTTRCVHMYVRICKYEPKSMEYDLEMEAGDCDAKTFRKQICI